MKISKEYIFITGKQKFKMESKLTYLHVIEVLLHVLLKVYALKFVAFSKCMQWT